MKALIATILISLALLQGSSAQSCYAPNTSNVCTPCPDGQVMQGQCIPFYYSHCYNSMDECKAVYPDPGACYAKNGWGPTAVCEACPVAPTSAGECPAFSHTKCSSTYEECSGGAPNPNPNPVTTTTTTRAPAPVITTTTTKAPAPVPVTTTTPSNNPSPSYDTCASCPANSLNLKRPTFRGPNCYVENTLYPQFGPKWAPSGKTAFEKLVPSPSYLYKFAQWKNWAEQPITKSMGTGCNGAVLVYENFVCAIEMLSAMGKKFPAAPNGQETTVDDFLNSGDTQQDLLELAAFLAHNWKETSGYAAFEEATSTPYADPSADYPAVDGKTYHGRGLFQISYNYNYGMFSEFIFGNKNALLYSPEDVDPEGPMGVISAIWFWMIPHEFTGRYANGSGGKMSPRDATIHATDGKLGQLYGDSKWNEVAGFGLSTNVINGGVECNMDSVTPAHAWRVTYMLTMMSRLGLTLPNYKDPAACNADTFCYSLIRGCAGKPSMPAGFKETSYPCGISIDNPIP